MIVGIAGSSFSIGKPSRIISPPAIPIIPVNVVARSLFILEQMAISAGWSAYPAIFKTAPNYTPRKTRESAKLESIHQDQSTHNLHSQHINLSSLCDHYVKIHRGLDNDKRVCETERFSKREKNFSDGAWCVERFHDRPFKILWRMKHTV